MNWKKFEKALEDFESQHLYSMPLTVLNLVRVLKKQSKYDRLAAQKIFKYSKRLIEILESK
jgi:hypothetical protein